MRAIDTTKAVQMLELLLEYLRTADTGHAAAFTTTGGTASSAL